MKVANLITLLRIIALPIIILLIPSYWALVILGLAILTDFIDGYIARKRKEVTKIGSFFDPFASKVLVIGLLLFFVIKDAFNWIPWIIFIVRDMVMGVVLWLGGRDDLNIQEEKGFGKIVLYAQMALILTLLLFTIRDTYLIDSLVSTFTVIAVALAIASIFSYLIVYINGLRYRRHFGKEVKNEKLVILANRKSRGYFNRYRRRLLRKFSKKRKARIIYLPRNGDMLKGIEKKINSNEQVIIAGGDGSFESALNYSPLYKKKLGFFPLGAGNAFYSYFYKGRRFEYLRSRFKFYETNLDILELEFNNEKRQTTFLSFGVDAEVPRLTSNRTEYGFRDYLKACVKGIFVAKAKYDFDCRVDGKKVFLKNSPGMTIAKIPYVGYAIRSLIGIVEPDDGQIYSLAVVNTHSPVFNKAMRVWGLILTVFGMYKHPLVALKGKEFIVKCDEKMPIQAGGEYLGETKEVKIRVLRKQKVLMI